MKLIVPIGGGNIASESTKSIDQFIIKKVKKEMPKVLFIPTASCDSISYIETFKKYYGVLGCDVDVLTLSTITNDNVIRSKIFSADIIYIGGGNTSRMLRIFKRFHIMDYLTIAYERGIILTGLSAGCICYFKEGLSDSNRSTDKEASLDFIKGMGFIPYSNCPHYNLEERKSYDMAIMNSDKVGIAIEDDVAIIFEEDKIVGTIKSNLDHKAYFISKVGKVEIG